MIARCKFPLAMILISSFAIQGCAALVVAGGVGAASSAHDRRSLGNQVDDNTLELKVSKALSPLRKDKQKPTHINIDVFNGIGLLSGQVATAQQRQQAETSASNIEGLKKVHNQLRIAQPTSAGTRTYDVWLASKVRANLLTDKRLDGLHISLVVEDSEVFLMGLVTRQEANIAVDVVRNIDGVARVIKAFEYI